jgi:hypothetical protein
MKDKVVEQSNVKGATFGLASNQKSDWPSKIKNGLKHKGDRMRMLTKCTLNCKKKKFFSFTASDQKADN